jgi:hypothetical protein
VCPEIRVSDFKRDGHGYLLTYTLDVVDKEGGFHKIALKANKDDLTMVTREGYYAPSGNAK